MQNLKKYLQIIYDMQENKIKYSKYILIINNYYN